VSVDITRAFDHVDIPLLLSLVEPLLRHEQYLVLKYSEVRDRGDGICRKCCGCPTAGAGNERHAGAALWS
jgi:hypothetical protein